MAALILLAIMVGCAALLYLKGTFARGFVMVFNAIVAGFFALGFYELVGGLLGKYVSALASWADTIAFLLIYIVVFAGLQTAMIQFDKAKMDLGQWLERIGRPICGLILGYILTGQLFVAAMMAPLPSGYPYPRFSQSNPNPAQPNKPMMNPDGFVVGLFTKISAGGFSALGEPKSFGMLHAGFLNQLYLNRLMISKGVPLRSTAQPGVRVPSGVREAPSTLRDSEGNALPSQPGKTLMLVAMEVNRAALGPDAKFSLSQVRLVCRSAANSARPLAGKGVTVYPVGYLGSGGRLVQEPLSAEVEVQGGGNSNRPRNIDVAFYVPNGYIPALLGFLNNSIEQVPVARPQTPSSGEDTDVAPAQTEAN